MNEKQTISITLTNEGDSLGLSFNYDPPLTDKGDKTDEEEFMQNIALGVTNNVIEFLQELD